MIEGENTVQYCTRIKEVVNTIWCVNGKIKDEIMIRKVLRTQISIYSIGVYEIQEVRCTPRNNLTLEAVISRLTTFEMSNFDNYTPATIENAFKSQLTVSKKKGKYVKIKSDIFDDDIDELEALIAKRFSRGRGK